MCGIVGLFLKKEDLRPRLGDMLTDMLITMTDRGPDSAGIAIYGDAEDGLKMTIQSDRPEVDFAGLEAALAQALGRSAGAPVDQYLPAFDAAFAPSQAHLRQQ